VCVTNGHGLLIIIHDGNRDSPRFLRGIHFNLPWEIQYYYPLRSNVSWIRTANYITSWIINIIPLSFVHTRGKHFLANTLICPQQLWSVTNCCCDYYYCCCWLVHSVAIEWKRITGFASLSLIFKSFPPNVPRNKWLLQWRHIPCKMREMKQVTRYSMGSRGSTTGMQTNTFSSPSNSEWFWRSLSLACNGQAYWELFVQGSQRTQREANRSPISNSDF
jgi:hypothetical protein